MREVNKMEVPKGDFQFRKENSGFVVLISKHQFLNVNYNWVLKKIDS